MSSESIQESVTLDPQVAMPEALIAQQLERHTSTLRENLRGIMYRMVVATSVAALFITPSSESGLQGSPASSIEVVDSQHGEPMPAVSVGPAEVPSAEATAQYEQTLPLGSVADSPIAGLSSTQELPVGPASSPATAAAPEATSAPLNPEVPGLVEIAPDRPSFNVAIESAAFQQGIVSFLAHPSSAESGQFVDLPEPAGEDWLDTSIFVMEGAYPASKEASGNNAGPIFVAAHKCLNHICPLTPIEVMEDGSINVKSDEKITITTPTGTINYRICGTGVSPKYNQDGSTASLTIPSCEGDSAPSTDLVVVTCADGDNNIVLSATLETATPTRQ